MKSLSRFVRNVIAKRDELKLAESVQPVVIRQEEFLQLDARPFMATADLFRFEMWCAKTGKPFVAVAERHGQNLLIVGNEPATEKLESTAWLGHHEAFEVDAEPSWRCPWCGVREDSRHDFLRVLWACIDPICGVPLHCCGSQQGIFRCACGQRMRREFVRSDMFKIREYHGLRGPAGRGRTFTSCPGGSERCYASYPGASTGSILK